MNKLAALVICCALALAPARAADMSSAATLVKPAPGGSAWTPAQVASLRHRIARLLKAPTLQGAQVGLIAIDTVRGTPIFSQNANQEFMPASNFKLLVGSAALDFLGTNFTYITTVGADAPPQGGTIAGNIYLKGGGDALLTAKDLDAAAAALAAQGIRHISGALLTDATRYDSVRYGYGWSWDDLPYYYAPVISALELEDGVVHMYFSPAPSAGLLAAVSTTPVSSAYVIDNRLITGPAKSKDDSELVRPWDQPSTIEVTGNYPADAKESGDVHPAVPDPELYAGDVFYRALSAHGITVSGEPRSGAMPSAATVLWSKHSEPMTQLLADFWYPSDNLMGELFLKELGVHYKGTPGTVENGRALEVQYLKSVGVNPATVAISDGSGLSSYDRITPRDLLLILQGDWKSPNRNVVLDALPVAGVRGTLRSSYKGTAAEKDVFAKTGSISHVRTISGYVITKSHGPVTFSFMINQWMGEEQPHGAADLARVRGAILAAIAAQ